MGVTLRDLAALQHRSKEPLVRGVAEGLVDRGAQAVAVDRVVAVLAG
jgi:hypothetical protein